MVVCCDLFFDHCDNKAIVIISLQTPLSNERDPEVFRLSKAMVIPPDNDTQWEQNMIFAEIIGAFSGQFALIIIPHYNQCRTLDSRDGMHVLSSHTASHLRS